MQGHSLISGKQFPVIKLVGIGDAGLKTVDFLLDCKLASVNFVVIGTDKKMPLKSSTVKSNRISILLIEKNKNEIMDALSESDLIFIVANIGDNADLETMLEVARLARESDKLTIGVNIQQCAQGDIHSLKDEEDKIMEICKDMDAFAMMPTDKAIQSERCNVWTDKNIAKSNEFLLKFVSGIADAISSPDSDIIGLDFDIDVKYILGNAGMAFVGIGEAYGENAAVQAARNAIENISHRERIKDATRVLLSITGATDCLNQSQVSEAADAVAKEVHSDAEIIFISMDDDSLEGEVRVLLIITGLAARE